MKTEKKFVMVSLEVETRKPIRWWKGWARQKIRGLRQVQVNVIRKKG